MEYTQEFSEYLKDIDKNFTGIMVHFNNSENTNSIQNFEIEKNLISDNELFLLLINSTNEFESNQLNSSDILKKSIDSRDSLSVILPITFIYALIFVAGVLGNAITCLVIAKNKSMHTATNYYLANLALSDFCVLIFGMPPDLYNIWYPSLYPFSETICILQGLLSETSANASVLTITSFTVERYIAICFPFRSHTMSSRVSKFIISIWVAAFALALPQALQFGVVIYQDGTKSCTVKNRYVHAFETSSFVFFIVPMTVIVVLYILIGLKLKKSKVMHSRKLNTSDGSRCSIKGQTRVIRMLIAVVLCFLICWTPFHVQRIMAIYGSIMEKNADNVIFMTSYTVVTYISGVLYFLSTCLNPLLYNIMSNKFRNAFKLTLLIHCYCNKAKTDTQLVTRYSAFSLRGGSVRVSTLNQNHFL